MHRRMPVEGFRKVQYCSWWVYAVLLGISALIVIIAVRSLWLETVVNDREVALHVRWLPAFTKRIPLAEVMQVEVSSSL
jgi:hypothetical protein